MIEGTDVTIGTYRAWGDFAGDQIAEFSFTAFEHVANLFATSPRKKYLGVYCPPANDGKDISGWAESSQSQRIAVWGGWNHCSSQQSSILVTRNDYHSRRKAND